MSPLDEALANLNEAPEDDAARLAVFELLASSELFLLLKAEPTEDAVEPRLFETTEGHFVLVFDREERLAEFSEGPAPYAALSGRRVAAMLQGQGIGLGLNIGVAPSSHLFSSEQIAWLAGVLENAPNQQSDTPEEFRPPNQLPETLFSALDSRLAQAEGLADLAYLAAVTYRNGRRGHLLALIDTCEGAEDALARAVQEALTFSGLEAGELDVTFLRSSNPTAAMLAEVGLRFDLPKARPTEPPTAPGMDPAKPPRLK